MKKSNVWLLVLWGKRRNTHGRFCNLRGYSKYAYSWDHSFTYIFYLFKFLINFCLIVIWLSAIGNEAFAIYFLCTLITATLMSSYKLVY